MAIFCPNLLVTLDVSRLRSTWHSQQHRNYHLTEVTISMKFCRLMTIIEIWFLRIKTDLLSGTRGQYHETKLRVKFNPTWQEFTLSFKNVEKSFNEAQWNSVRWNFTPNFCLVKLAPAIINFVSIGKIWNSRNLASQYWHVGRNIS